VARRSDDAGAIAIVVAVFAVVMFAFGALIVDLGLARSIRLEARAAADAAALAGAGELYEDSDTIPDIPGAVAEVKQVAAHSFGTTDGQWSTCSAPVPTGWFAAPGTSCIAFRRPESRPARIQVTLPPRRSGASIGAAVGYTGLDVTARSRAMALDESIPECSLCITFDLDVDGQVFVDGDGSAFAGEGAVGAAGNITVQGGGVIGFTAAPNPPDDPAKYSPNPPLVGLTPRDPYVGQGVLPSLPTTISTDTACGRGGDPPLQTYDPLTGTGVAYRNLTVHGTCTIPDGVLFVTGKLDFQTPPSAMEGNNVTLYFGCQDSNTVQLCSNIGSSASASRGWLDVDKQSEVRILGSWYAGLSLLVEPFNSQPLVIGDGTVSLGGGLYHHSGPTTVGVADGSNVGLLDVNGALAAPSSMTVYANSRFELFASGVERRSGAPHVALIK
jgi:Putative Flp pilus-assembly TadE/G-like